MNTIGKKALLFCVIIATAFTQNLSSNDTVLKGMWDEAHNNSQLKIMGHELLDVIGPRLTGTPQQKIAHDWAVEKLESWDIDAENEAYGKWRQWERGVSHIDLLSPRVRTLEGMALAWSPGTHDGPITAEAIIFPDLTDEAAYKEWLEDIDGKFILVNAAYENGRPDENWDKNATKESFEKMKKDRKAVQDNWKERYKKSGLSNGYRGNTLHAALEKAGAAGIITSRWSKGWGVTKIFGANTKKIVSVDLSLEDYGLVYRLAENGDKPELRIFTDSKLGGETETFNTIGTIKGSEKPDEYVVLSAHFDSWDGASGATDNGTGTLTMLEAIRLLKKVYKNPKRSIVIGLWGSEEQGLNGSRSYVKDHPEVVKGLQALFNQDNGTGRVIRVSGSGFKHAGEYMGRWLSMVPRDVTKHIESYNFPGTPSSGGTDHAAFVAAGAPGFSLSSLSWNYWNYTWHTNRDTYDKIVWDDVMNNAILAASLAYLASEDEKFFPRDKREKMPISRRSGKVVTWPKAKDGKRRGRLD